MLLQYAVNSQELLSLHVLYIYSHIQSTVLYTILHVYHRLLFYNYHKLFSLHRPIDVCRWFSILLSSSFPSVLQTALSSYTLPGSPGHEHIHSHLSVYPQKHSHMHPHAHRHVRETIALDSALEDGGRIICQSCSGITVRFFRAEVIHKLFWDQLRIWDLACRCRSDCWPDVRNS